MSDELLRAYRLHLEDEPEFAPDAAPWPVHEERAQAHREWARRAGAYRTLLAPRLLEDAMARLDKEEAR